MVHRGLCNSPALLVAALFQSWHGIFKCKGQVSPNYMLITFSKLQLVLKWFSRCLNSHTFVCCLLYAVCSFSDDYAYFWPKSWFGSCSTTNDVFILFEDLWSYPWPQLSEIHTHAHIFSLQAKNRDRNRLYSCGSQMLLIKGLPDLQKKIVSGSYCIWCCHPGVHLWPNNFFTG